MRVVRVRARQGPPQPVQPERSPTMRLRHDCQILVQLQLQLQLVDKNGCEIR
jgi:hypothetical protein